jgi:hypothetical protein
MVDWHHVSEPSGAPETSAELSGTFNPVGIRGYLAAGDCHVSAVRTGVLSEGASIGLSSRFRVFFCVLVCVCVCRSAAGVFFLTLVVFLFFFFFFLILHIH